MTSPAPESWRVEYRCPRYNSLFAVAQLGRASLDGDVLEFACRRCKQEANRSGHPAMVVHRFTLSGVFVATLIQARDSLEGS